MSAYNFNSNIYHNNATENSNEVDVVELQAELEKCHKEKNVLQQNKIELTDLISDQLSQIEKLKDESEKNSIESKKLKDTNSQLLEQINSLKNDHLIKDSQLESTIADKNTLQVECHGLKSELKFQKEQFIKFKEGKEESFKSNMLKMQENSDEVVLLKANIKALQEKNDETSKKLYQKMVEVSELKESSKSNKNYLEHELELQKNLVTLMEDQIKSMKNELTKSNSSTSMEKNQKSSVYMKQVRILENKLQHTELEKARLQAIIQDIQNNHDSVKLDVSHNHGDLIILKTQLTKERQEKQDLKRELELFITEMENNVPILESYREKTDSLEKLVKEKTLNLESSKKRICKNEDELEALRKSLTEHKKANLQLSRERMDLARQLQYILLHTASQDPKRGLLDKNELQFIRDVLNGNDPNAISSSQQIISSRMVEFQNIMQLQEQNENLLRAVRFLTDKAESLEKSMNEHEMQGDISVVDEAKDAIVTLQDYNKSLEQTIDTLKKELDEYRNGSRISETYKQNNIEQSLKREKITDLENQLESLNTKSITTIEKLKQEIDELRSFNTTVSLKYEEEKSKYGLAEDKLKLLTGTIELTKAEIKQLKLRLTHCQETMSNYDNRMTHILSDFVNCKSKLSQKEEELHTSKSELDALSESHEHMTVKLQELQDKINSLRESEMRLKLVNEQQTMELQLIKSTFEEVSTDQEQKNKSMMEKLKQKELETMKLITERDTELKWYQDKIDTLRNQNQRLNDQTTTATKEDST